MRLLIIIIVLIAQESIAQNSKMLGSGIVFLKSDFKQLKVLNSNGTVYLKLFTNKGGELITEYVFSIQPNEIETTAKMYYPYYYLAHIKYGTPFPKLAIRAFFPDYNIAVFDAVKLKRGYNVFINGSWKYIDLGKSIDYKDWNLFIKQVFVKVDKKYPLYKEDNAKSALVSTCEDYSYKVLEVKGDWIKVTCYNECEGCPKGKILSGWIRWKERDSILLELFYSC